MLATSLRLLTKPTTRKSLPKCWLTTERIIQNADPLDLWRDECHQANFCDTEGNRLPSTHWTFCLSYNNGQKAPHVKTVGLQRLNSLGIDFVLSSKSSVDQASFLYTRGAFAPGQSAEQWRGHGTCESIDDLESVLKVTPPHTVVGMVGTRRLQLELISDNETKVPNQSHFTQVMQETRRDWEGNRISVEELRDSIQAVRLVPERLEYMKGGPNAVMWDRWEWLRREDETWDQPSRIIPY